MLDWNILLICVGFAILSIVLSLCKLIDLLERMSVLAKCFYCGKL